MSGEVVGATIKEQAFQTLYNLKAVLDAAGLDISDITKTNVFLTSMDDFDGFNEVYAEFMGITVRRDSAWGPVKSLTDACWKWMQSLTRISR